MTFCIDKLYVENLHTDKFYFERIVKYARKKNLTANFYIPKAEENFYNWLLNCAKKPHGHLGYINDNVYIVHNPLNLPDAPKDWDILCVNGEVSSYDFSDENNNVYWVRSRLKNSNTFIINGEKLLNILTVFQMIMIDSRNKSSFFERLSSQLKTFVITQYFFTENTSTSVEKDKTKSKNKDWTEYYAENSKFMDKLMVSHPAAPLDYAPKDYVLTGYPKISFVIPLYNFANFHHNFLLLSQLNYLNYDIIVVDFMGYEKKVKHLLKAHANRVRLIEINGVDYSKKYGEINKKIPLGFIFNSAIKSCKADVIFPFFPDRHYNIQEVERLVVNYLFSKKECFIGKDLKSYNVSDNKIYNYTQRDLCLSNMFFSQKFWLCYPFDESCDDEKTMIYKFIKDRLNLVHFYNSSEWCYHVENTKKEEVGGESKLSDIHVNSLGVFTL